VLEARRHFAGLDRGDLFIGQIDGPKARRSRPALWRRLAEPASPAVAGGVLFWPG